MFSTSLHYCLHTGPCPPGSVYNVEGGTGQPWPLPGLLTTEGVCMESPPRAYILWECSCPGTAHLYPGKRAEPSLKLLSEADEVGVQVKPVLGSELTDM